MLSLRAALGPCRRQTLLAYRSFNSTAVDADARKRRKKQAAVPDDEGALFDDGAETGDLFSSEPSAPSSTQATASAPAPSASASAATPTAASATSQAKPKSRPGALDPTERRARYDALFHRVADRIGPQPVVEREPVRTTAFSHLFDLAQTPDELDAVAGLFVPFAQGKRQLGQQEWVNFLQRCAELNCPSLALKILSDRPNHRIDTIPIALARRLLFLFARAQPSPLSASPSTFATTTSLQPASLSSASHNLASDLSGEKGRTPSRQTAARSLTGAVQLAALFGVYRLPAIAKDPLSCAFMACACLRTEAYALTHAHAHAPLANDAKGLADALLASLKASMTGKDAQLDPKEMAVPKEGGERHWFRMALKDITLHLKARGRDVGWLAKWMVKAGYAKAQAYPETRSARTADKPPQPAASPSKQEPRKAMAA